jgi:DNA modification methylase
MALPNNLPAIHPFPARMAPELAWDELPSRTARRLRVLDPMAGSGTTLVAAKLRGHEAIGFDRDPLAVLITRSWLSNAKPHAVRSTASKVLEKARSRARTIKTANAFPPCADDETKAFARYWFDSANRLQLTALAESIVRLQDRSLRDLMWCAFSRLIITKTVGVSLAKDVSHSRPHRSYEKAPINAFDRFERAVDHIIKSSAFSNTCKNYAAGSVALADARNLPMRDNSVDIVITSPPYLNAIDYIRGHKFSLIWMGHSLSALRAVRSTNVGTETMAIAQDDDLATEFIMQLMCPVENLSKRNTGMLRRYVRDMRRVLSETKRVLHPGGKAVFVVGNCNVRETFVQNSKCVQGLAKELGLSVERERIRPLPDNRRYLPPPQSRGACGSLRKRMREEVILTLIKR